MLVELNFMNDKCQLVHSDISITNIMIIRPDSLPDLVILPTSSDSSLLCIAEQQSADSSSSSSSSNSSSVSLVTDPQGSVSSANSDLLPIPSEAVPSGVVAPNTVPWDTMKPCDKEGLPYDLPSGGGVIDFDYSHANNLSSTKRSVCFCLLIFRKNVR